jgi:MOSC domain-containing protein YiiM
MSEGEVGSGDTVELIRTGHGGVTVGDIFQLYGSHKDDLALLRRAVEVRALSEDWRSYFQKRIDKLEARSS